MRGNITAKVLEVIKDVAVSTADLFDVFLSVGYGASLGKFEYALRQREKYRAKAETDLRMHHRYYTLLHHLEQQGLIVRKKKDNTVFARLTKKGEYKLSLLKKQLRDDLPPRHYEREENKGHFIVVAFDIPEHSKRKRNWLRDVLRHFGMTMVQKSVWAGKLKLPKQFVEDLRNYKLLEYVEIFEISKTGSLREIM